MSMLTLALIEQCHSCFYGNSPRMPCPCLEWQERTWTHTQTHTHTELDANSGAAQCRLWSVVYVATMCQSICHIAECWNPFSSAVCRPWTHKVLRCTFELGDCRWTAAVTVPQWQRRLLYDLFLWIPAMKQVRLGLPHVICICWITFDLHLKKRLLFYACRVFWSQCGFIFISTVMQQ